MGELFQPVYGDLFLARWTFLLYLGLAFVITYQAGYLNLGIAAQLIGGALAATFTASYTQSFTLSFLAGLTTSLLFGIAPAALRAFLRLDEAFTTLMLGFLAVPLAQFLMRSTRDGMDIASPNVDLTSTDEFLLMGKYFNLIHLLVFPFIAICIVYMRSSVFGYQARVLASNPKIFSAKQHFKILFVAHCMSSFAITLAVMADIYLYNRRYANGYYDQRGFIGVTVGLMALAMPLRLTAVALLFAGLLVAVVEVGFVFASIKYGVPEMGSAVVFGGIIAVAAILLRRRGVRT